MKYANSLNSLLSDCINSKEFTVLHKSLKNLHIKLQSLLYENKSDNFNQFVYGICALSNSYRELLQYNIHSKQLNVVASIPYYASVIQIKKNVYISGGWYPCVNTLSMYIDSKKVMIEKKSMIYPKYCHAVEVIFNNSFVTVGGFDNSGVIRYCEKYSITENEWSKLPSLKKARDYCGTAFLNNRFLYAIGGKHSTNSIEMLNINENEEWIIINLVVNVLSINNNPLSFPISNTKVIIVYGDGSVNVGLFNIMDNNVERLPIFTVIDHYYHSTPVFIGTKVYTIGNRGYIHIFNLLSRKFTETTLFESNLLN